MSYETLTVEAVTAVAVARPARMLESFILGGKVESKSTQV